MMLPHFGRDRVLCFHVVEVSDGISEERVQRCGFVCVQFVQSSLFSLELHVYRGMYRYTLMLMYRKFGNIGENTWGNQYMIPSEGFGGSMGPAGGAGVRGTKDGRAGPHINEAAILDQRVQGLKIRNVGIEIPQDDNMF